MRKSKKMSCFIDSKYPIPVQTVCLMTWLVMHKSHIGRSPADPVDWVLHRSSCIIGRVLIGSGVAVTHFKDGKTMLVGCAATSIGSQSCTNQLDICRTSGCRQAMTFEIGRLFVICWQSAAHRTSIGRFQGTSPDDLPRIIGDIGRFHSWLGGDPSRVGSPSTDARPMFMMFGRA